MILRLKRTPGIYLVGFMACGKTTVGRLLAQELGWLFVDIDDEVEAKAGATINEIFDTRGEAEFRKLEAEAIAGRVSRIERGEATVVAVGGGAFVQPRNYELLACNGISIWLDCPLEVLRRRVAQQSNRPLARDPKRFAELYEKRRPSYSRADFHVEASEDDPRPVVERILKLPIF